MGMLLGMQGMTTIKVSRDLRQRISEDAAERGVTAAVLISELLDNYEREQRLAAVGRVYLGARDVGYVEEIAAWDQTSSDGPNE